MDSTIPCVIGVDVGGTNTDAVVLLENKVVCWSKQTTTADVTNGVLNALYSLLNKCKEKEIKLKIQQINIGTTHFVNAVVQRSRSLSKVAVIRLAKPPCTQSIKPFSDFPSSLKNIVDGGYVYVNGGYEFDGRQMSEVNETEILKVAKEFINRNVKNFVICGVFSSTKKDQEQKVAEILKNNFHDVSFSCSHELGQIGLLERENASILNESLKNLCRKTIGGLQTGLHKLGLKCPLYFTENDGTICSIERALMYPVFTFASGPTNSMRGAAFVSGLKDAIVVDIGGTSTDIGVLVNGFPRQAGARVLVGEVPTNFRMPHTLSLALGGGTKVALNKQGDISIGPESVGYKLTKEAICFGGNVLTTTDAAVAAGLVPGVPTSQRLTNSLQCKEVSNILECIRQMVENGIDQMKTDAAPVPVILVGGGSVLIDKTKSLGAANLAIAVEHHLVANAIGAALCQISGQIDVVVPMDPHGSERPGYVENIKRNATEIAVKNGAIENAVEIVEFDEIPLTYLPGNAVRMKCIAVGPLKVDHSRSQDIDLSSLPEINLLPQETESEVNQSKLENKTANDLINSYVPHSLLTEQPWSLNLTDIEYICAGAAILGCGGGGSPHVGKLRLMNLLEDGKQPTVVSHKWLLKNVESQLQVYSVGFMGAPVIIIEKMPSGYESLNAIRVLHAIDKNKEFLDLKNVKNDLDCDFIDNVALPQHTNVSSADSAVMTPEVGGLNSTEALAVSALFGVHCVDADEMGRAFPELQMSTKLIHGHPSFPCVQANDQGRQTVTLKAKSNKAVENLNRKICIENGCSSAFVLGSIHVEDVEQCCVVGSITRAWTLGKSIFEAKVQKRSPLQAVLDVETGKLICSGKLVDVQRKIESGFSRGYFILEGLNNYSGQVYRVEFQNENLIIWNNKKCIATVPDLICIMDTETGEAIPTEDLRYGLRASLLVLKPSHLLTTHKALEVVGPKAFGYKDLDYIPFCAS